MKAAILGNPETILGFKAVGLDVFGVRTQKEAEEKIDEIYRKGNHAMLLITEDWFLRLKEKIKKLEESALPAIIFIPGIGGSAGFIEKELQNTIERAVGSDIFSKK